MEDGSCSLSSTTSKRLWGLTVNPLCADSLLIWPSLCSQANSGDDVTLSVVCCPQMETTPPEASLRLLREHTEHLVLGLSQGKSPEAGDFRKVVLI